MRTLDGEVVRQDANYEPFLRLQVLDLGPEFEEKVVLVSIVLDRCEHVSEALDLVYQLNQAAEVRVNSVPPALPFFHPRDQLELVTCFSEQSDVDFAASRKFVGQRLEVVQSCLVEPVLFL